jgi:Ca2+-binding RTX toxin-like protein
VVAITAAGLGLAGVDSAASSHAPRSASVYWSGSEGHTTLDVLGTNQSEAIRLHPANPSGAKVDISVSRGLKNQSPKSCRSLSPSEVICPAAGQVTVIAGGGDDRVHVTGGSPAIDGDDGRDKLVVSGEDQPLLSGGGGDDNLRGGSGRDFLVGGPGADRLSGGRNDDSVAAKWHKSDRDYLIACGKGRDKFNLDKSDPAPRGCEKRLPKAVD